MTTSDVNRPSTWTKYTPSNCLICTSECCKLPVEVYKEDLIRLGLTDEFEFEASPKKLAKRLIKEGIIQSYQSSDHCYILSQKAFDECIFLDKNKNCSVYETRPETCRNHPKVGPRPGYCAFKPKT